MGTQIQIVDFLKFLSTPLFHENTSEVQKKGLQFFSSKSYIIKKILGRRKIKKGLHIFWKIMDLKKICWQIAKDRLIRKI